MQCYKLPKPTKKPSQTLYTPQKSLHLSENHRELTYSQTLTISNHFSLNPSNHPNHSNPSEPHQTFSNSPEPVQTLPNPYQTCLAIPGVNF